MPDEESRADVAGHLRLTFPRLEALNNPFITVRREEAGVGRTIVHDHMSRGEVRRACKMGWSVRHPDVLVWAHGRNDTLVRGGRTRVVDRRHLAAIEIDGSIHAKRSHLTERRNEWYETYGIPLLVIEDAEVAGDGMWRDAVDEFVTGTFPEVLE